MEVSPSYWSGRVPPYWSDTPHGAQVIVVSHLRQATGKFECCRKLFSFFGVHPSLLEVCKHRRGYGIKLVEQLRVQCKEIRFLIRIDPP